MASAPWDIYADQLFPLKYGHTLWLPDSFGEEVNIGDVGYLESGGFKALFNTIALDEQASDRPRPPSFQHIDFHRDDVMTCPMITQPFVCSRSIRKVEFQAEGEISGEM